MNAILGFAQLLELDRSLNADHQDSIREIHQAGTYLMELINEILDLARIEAGKIRLELGAVEIGPLIDECERLVAPQAEASQLHINGPKENCAGIAVVADPSRLKQVLLNLLSNAIKYNVPQGQVFVSCQLQRQGHCRISVSDTGPGIVRQNLGRLFDEFDRLGAEAGTVDGSGVGLAVSKRLVELMGGEIGVQSDQGKGSTFWIQLACRKPPVRSVPLAAPEPNTNS